MVMPAQVHTQAIRTRILIIFIWIGLFVAASSAITIKGTQAIKEQLFHISDSASLRVRTLLDLEDSTATLVHDESMDDLAEFDRQERRYQRLINLDESVSSQVRQLAGRIHDVAPGVESSFTAMVQAPDADAQSAARGEFIIATNVLQTAVRSALDRELQIIELSVEEAHGASDSTSQIGLGFAVVFFLAVILSGLLLHRFIAKPILKLRDGVLTFAEGNFDTTIDVKMGGEVGDLASSFNTMAAKLKQLDEAKTGFISVASHQLRTPLTSMRWFSEMLMGGDAGEISPEQRHFVERIYEGTERMVALVNLLLQIARVEAGRLKVEPIPLDLKAVTESVAASLKTGLEGKKQTVEITSEPTPFPMIPADQEVIWQCVQNLLANANRYAPVSSVIHIGIKKKKDEIEYSVKDTGIGIPKAQQGRIFEKFFRAENALKAVPEGSGLGLSLVKSLVEGWGGKIWFETEEGKGTTFFFTLPATGMKAKEGEVRLAV
jgi:signal transduction histidine kinase